MTEPSYVSPDTFADRLGHLLLVAFATGRTVEGEYDLSLDHEMIPEIRVSILGVGTNDTPSSDDATVELGDENFETRLETFLLSEYARGVRLDGVWEIRYARSSFPEWSVDIQMSEPAASESDGPPSPRAPNTRQ